MLAAKLGPENPETLLALLKQRIMTDGPLTIADYMEACLSDPEFGYYMTRDPFGRAGDFTTAPEISQIFGELLGLWSVVIWEQMGSPGRVCLIELGPGRGTLMADALRAAKTIPGFLDACELHLVETSPVLRSMQGEQLVSTGTSPHWHDELGEVPAGPTILIANEFLDALPVHQFVITEGQWFERRVGLSTAGTLEFQNCMVGQKLESLISKQQREEARDGDVVECRPAGGEIVNLLAARAQQEPMAALFIDYGHDTSAPGDTLQAVHTHEYTNPLEIPGGADLTAHVDFGSLRETAQQHGLSVHGPTSQSEFLLALGLKERCERLMANADKAGRKKVASGAQRLVDPVQMGELFRVMALTCANLIPPPFPDLGSRSETR